MSEVVAEMSVTESANSSLDTTDDLDTTNTESLAESDTNIDFGNSEDSAYFASTSIIKASTPLASYRDYNHVEELQNNTERSITTFDRFVSSGWPENCNNEAIEMLQLQLKYGGGFSSTMKTINLITPKNVRLDIDKVLTLLEGKMRHSSVESVEKFVLPVVTKLYSGDQVKKLLVSFCKSLSGGSSTPPKINEIVLHFDEITDDFSAGDMSWIEEFHSAISQDKYCTTTIKIFCTVFSTKKDVKKAFKEFRSNLCAGKHQDTFSLEYFRKRNSAPINTKNKRYRNDVTPMETSLSSANAITKSDDSSTITNNTFKSTKKNLTYTLAESWRTVEIHDRGIDGTGVTIAFLDSGINIMHRSFAGRIKAVHDITYSGDIDLTTDRYGPGTMSAFIASGKPFKPIGSSIPVPAGVAPGASIVSYKIAECTGKAHPDIITTGLRQCLDDKEWYGIDIVVLPYGSSSHDLNQGRVIRELVNSGVLVVTASGNKGLAEDIPYPARLGCTICVGAHNKHCKTTSCSGEGDVLDFTAPGEDITAASSDHPTAFETVHGTSCAAACVAGLLALIIQHARSIAKNAKQLPVTLSKVEELVHDQDVIKKVLRKISRFPTRRDHSCGHGNLNPFAIFSDHKLLDYLFEDILITQICSPVKC